MELGCSLRLLGILHIVSFVSALAAEPPPLPASALNRARPLSTDLANAITAALPKYQPPEAAKETTDEDFELPAPRNGIIRLPRVVVEGNRPPIFTERELHTDKGLAEVAVKRYFNDTGLALNKFTLPLVGMTKEAYAMLLWQQDRRLGQIREFAEQATLDEALGEGHRAAELRTLINDTLGQPPLFHGVHRTALRDARGE